MSLVVVDCELDQGQCFGHRWRADRPTDAILAYSDDFALLARPARRIRVPEDCSR
jgi:hypothetical protein